MKQNTCANPGIFVRGGPGQSAKKALTFFFVLFFLVSSLWRFFLVLSLFYRSQTVNFKENCHFQGSGGGPTFSRGGPTFSRGPSFSRGGPIAYSL